MAYYSGVCTDYQHLADILVEKCQVHGWAWQDNILSKDDLFVKLTVSQKDRSNAGGIIIAGGTGKQGTTLINPSTHTPRLGNPSYTHNDETHFPARYHCFVFDNEVYLLVAVGSYYYYLAFGKSALIVSNNANGLWLSATALVGSFSHTNHVNINTTYGGAGGWVSLIAPAPFWCRADSFAQQNNSIICHGLDNQLWSAGSVSAFCTFEPLIERMPTNNFLDSPLLPYNIYAYRPENKLSLVAQLTNVRCVRVDYYESEQILTLGHERWMVFPFYKKEIRSRNGGGWIDHTGTFGWAIRYEG